MLNSFQELSGLLNDTVNVSFLEKWAKVLVLNFACLWQAVKEFLKMTVFLTHRIAVPVQKAER